jgi:hypothetical protein
MGMAIKSEKLIRMARPRRRILTQVFGIERKITIRPRGERA